MRQKIIGMLPVLSVVILAALASREAHLARMGLSMLTLAILIGMLVGNTLYPRISAHCHEGVVFSKGQLLRLGIILYGFRLTLAQVAAVGMNSILADAIMLTTTFLLTCWIGIRWLNIERHTVWLMGAGSGICGAAAMPTSASSCKVTHKSATCTRGRRTSRCAPSARRKTTWSSAACAPSVTASTPAPLT